MQQRKKLNHVMQDSRDWCMKDLETAELPPKNPTVESGDCNN